MPQKDIDKEVRSIFSELLQKFFNPDREPLLNDDEVDELPYKTDEDIQKEEQLIVEFLNEPCTCGRDCQVQFTANELLGSRTKFSRMRTSEKNCFILSQLVTFVRHADFAYSARTETPRQRQKFEYRINADRTVCKNAFLFYYGESIDRLKRLQRNLLVRGIELPIHGNTGCKPVHACSQSDKEIVKSFIINYSINEGLPDPGRDVRNGKGKLRVFLPSVMSYLSIHKLYQECMKGSENNVVGYRTFVRIWQEELPHIVFNNPKTDLCIQCENFKKQINQVTAILNEEKEALQTQLYKSAINHLNHAKKERLYYRAHAQLAHKNYQKLLSSNLPSPKKPNSIDAMMHYSWDFAQQLHYPFEDQQVGPIYFKTPRRAQLFGVCCEGIPRQINYLIDEADFLEKNANTVISLLDHFFEHHGMGETSVYLTADNCVGQNKNNALIQYLMYRVLTGLHSNIELSFLVVGHTKFSPDGYFGLIRQKYRRSCVYTYDNLATVIEESSPNGHNICQRYSVNNQPEVIYRNWSDWLSQYFKVVSGITGYHHFKLNHNQRGTIIVKQSIDAKETTINLLNDKTFPYNKPLEPSEKPEKLEPTGLSEERQWYLYNQIRMHIPDEFEKNQTCPKPKRAQQKK